MDENLRKVSKGAALIFLGSLIASILNYGSRIIIARFYDPSGYGSISLGMAILSVFVTISIIGLREGIASWISYYIDDKPKIKFILKSSFKITLPLSIILAILMFFGSDYIAQLLGNSQLSIIIRIFSFCLPVLVIKEIFVSTIRGLQNALYKVLSFDIFWPGSRFFLTLLVAYMGYNLSGIAFVYLIALLFSTIFSAYLLYKLFPFRKIESGDSFPLKKLFSFSWPLFLTTIIYSLLRWLDLFMIGSMKGTYDVGIYEAALPTASMLLMVLGSFNYLLLPKFSELFSSEKYTELKKLYTNVTGYIVFLTLPLLLLLLTYSRDVISIFFGEAYVVATSTLVVLTLGYFYSTVVGPSGNLIIASGKTKIIFLIMLTNLVSNFFLNYLLIPNYSYLGAGISLTLSMFIAWSISLFYVYKIINYVPFRKDFLKPLTVSLLGIIPIILLTNYIETSLVSMVLTSLLYLGYYFYCLDRLEVLKLNDFLRILPF